jgi:hypothetical protein
VGRTCGLAGKAADGAAEEAAVVVVVAAAVALSMLGARMPSLKSREDGHVEDVTATTTLQSSASALASAASKVAVVTLAIDHVALLDVSTRRKPIRELDPLFFIAVIPPPPTYSLLHGDHCALEAAAGEREL